MKNFCRIIFAFSILSWHSYTYSNIFETYGKRHLAIRKHFVEILSNENTTWQQDGCTYPDKEQRMFVFLPEKEIFKTRYGQDKKWNERFIYHEFDLSESKPEIKKLCNIDSFYSTLFREKKKSPHCTENIISQDKNQICFEAYMNSGLLFSKTKHKLVKIVHLGGVKYIAYQYEISDRNLSPEEKDYWFKMFDYATQVAYY